ncbi:hypothetical protein LIER_38770 [Lithospermum erythrorhizon]|uniref:Uncharacterized protein n=1 Tax=Lithospermum erythrorhizon TaxID=34254 RepID=A0AAV3Q5H8_LITER
MILGYSHTSLGCGSPETKDTNVFRATRSPRGQPPRTEPTHVVHSDPNEVQSPRLQVTSVRSPRQKSPHYIGYDRPLPL